MGHCMLQAPIVYTDGEMVGYCSTCGDRMRVPWIPGGTAAARAKGVALNILMTNGPPAMAQIERLRVALEHIKEDELVIESAKEHIELAMERL